VVITMDFTQGGSLGGLEVRTWDGVAFSAPVLVPAGCDGTDIVCGFNNNETIAGGDWDSFDSHGDVIANLTANTFTEIGVNISAIVGETPCFGTIQAKTRSSQEFTAELKDFAL